MPSEKATYSSSVSDLALQHKAMDLEHGWLGKVFGSSKNAPINIAGFFLILLAIPGIGLLFCDGKMPAGDYWKLFSPIATLILGYMFGRKAE
jgi:hypothetical protein